MKHQFETLKESVMRWHHIFEELYSNTTGLPLEKKAMKN